MASREAKTFWGILLSAVGLIVTAVLWIAVYVALIAGIVWVVKSVWMA